MRLESDVAHMRSDVAEIKVDIRALRDRRHRHGDCLAGQGARLLVRAEQVVGIA
jgi:hypothetical protein